MLLFISLVAFLVSSCEFNQDINTDPNLPSEVKSSQLIANAMLSLPGLSSIPKAEYYAQYLSKVIYVQPVFYPKGTDSFYWIYEGPLIDLKKAIENTKNKNEIAVAKILEAYYFWNVTDRWGDVPYSDALKGRDNFIPAYDKQQDIYDKLFTLLKKAGDQLNSENRKLEDDIMYNGDIEKWRKFSNTVRMLMALRLSNVDEQKAKKEFKDALSDGVMESNDDSFVYQHLSNQNNENFWFNQIVRQTRVWWALPTRLIDMMKPYDDPRLAVYGNKAKATGDYSGLPYGTEESDIGSTSQYSLLGSDIYKQDAPVYLTTYAETEFARAEAAARHWTNENPKKHYKQAVKASVEQWTGSDNGAAQLLQEQPYDPSAPIEQISDQRYIHLFMYGYEAWSAWRRTGYPDNMVKPNGKDIPRRLAYPSDEKLNNTDHYQEAIDRQFNGDNSIYGRVWWDVK